MEVLVPHTSSQTPIHALPKMIFEDSESRNACRMFRWLGSYMLDMAVHVLRTIPWGLYAEATQLMNRLHSFACRYIIWVKVR